MKDRISTFTYFIFSYRSLLTLQSQEIAIYHAKNIPCLLSTFSLYHLSVNFFLGIVAICDPWIVVDDFINDHTLRFECCLEKLWKDCIFPMLFNISCISLGTNGKIEVLMKSFNLSTFSCHYVVSMSPTLLHSQSLRLLSLSLSLFSSHPIFYLFNLCLKVLQTLKDHILIDK